LPPPRSTLFPYTTLFRSTDEQSLVRSLDAARCRDLMNKKIIEEGMIPKVEACLEGLQAGVGKTHIVDGRVRHSLLLEIFTDRGVDRKSTRLNSSHQIISY